MDLSVPRRVEWRNEYARPHALVTLLVKTKSEITGHPFSSPAIPFLTATLLPMTSRLFVAPTKPILRASLRSLPSNGHDAFIPQIRKIIFEYCETWPTSTNMRTYILNHLEDVARQNPHVEIVVKYRPHREPIVRGLYCESHYFWETDGDATDFVTRSEHPRQSYRSERLRGQWNTEESRVAPRFIWSEDQAAERQPSCGEYDGSG